MKYCLILLITLLSSKFHTGNDENSLFSNDTNQSQVGCPKKIIKWVSQLDSEYPGENLDKVEGEKIQKIVYNLYSDRYFANIFDEPFDVISKKKLEIIAKAGTSGLCTSIIPGNHFELTNPAKDAIGEKMNRSGDASISFSYENVKFQVIRLRKIRQDAQSFLTDLEKNNSNIDLKTVDNWRQKIQDEFSPLMPSELNLFSNLIDKHEHKIVQRITISEKDKLDKIGNSEKDVLEINAFYEKFDKKYSPLKHCNEIKDLYTDISSKKSLIILSLANKINNLINTSSTSAELTQIEDKYFSYLDLNAPSLSDLYSNFRSKKQMVQKIEHEQELVKKAEERKITQQKEKEILEEKKKLALRKMKELFNGQENASNFTTEDYKLISDEFIVEKSTNDDLRRLVELFKKSNEIYLVDLDRNTAHKLDDIKIDDEYIEFSTIYSNGCKISITNGGVEYLFDAEKAIREKNYSNYQRALSCSNFKEYFKIQKIRFSINEVLRHKKEDFITAWRTRTENMYCSQIGLIYLRDFCDLNCRNQMKIGEMNFLLIPSKSIATFFIKDE